MSLRRRGGRITTRTFGLAAVLAIVAAVSLTVGGAGAARSPGATGLKATPDRGDGIVDVSKYLGRNSNFPVRLSARKALPSKKFIRQAKQLRTKQLKLRKQLRAKARLKSQRGARSFLNHNPTVGETRVWLALDDSLGFYRKQFVLRGLSDHTEIWVAKAVPRTVGAFTATGTNFLDGDCRNGARTTITDAQVNYLAGEFDNNILPKESVEFSVAPDRDGSNEVATSIFGPTFQDQPIDPTGQGDRTVVLVDNVRDDNFRDFNNTQGNSYIAGFFSSTLNEVFDRNIMSIDAFDWLHRTGANPPHEPVPGNLCTSAAARPFLYEGVFAHEYQHLLQYYVDPEEVNFINEGLSDFAIDLTGYDFPERGVDELGFDSHLQCFMGNLVFQTEFNPNPSGGGPENSLTSWGDQGDDEILCDYGAAFSFMEYLSTQFGSAFMSALHRNPLEGLAGLQDQLGSQATSEQVIHRWLAAMALDAQLDNGADLRGANASAYQIDALHAAINWNNPDAYSTPGAPPNGADFVRLRLNDRVFMRSNGIQSVSFNGARTLEPVPVEWAVTTSAPDHGTDAALAAPDADNKDASIVHSVTVPADDPTLTFDTLYDTEPAFDSLFVQVSTDGGATYHSLSNEHTTCDLDPGANSTLKDNCPGFNGSSGGWVTETMDLTPYAGQTILLAFRYVTDTNTRGAGVWIDNVRVGDTVVSDGSSLAGWRTFTQIKPIPVNGFTVQLVGYRTTPPNPRRAFVVSLPLSNQEKLTIFNAKADVVAALVTYDEPTESISQYARYTLKVNGITQPGG